MIRRVLERLGLRKKRRGVTVSAVVYRADGTVEDLGVIGRGEVEVKPRRD